MTEPDAGSPPPLRIRENRRVRKYAPGEQVLRVLWGLCGPLFRCSPRPAWAWRRALLRLFGARLGRDVHVYPTARIMFPWKLSVGDEAAIGDRVLVYNLGPIHIGAQVAVSHGAHLCAGTHDYTRSDLPLIKASIFIEAGAWICADAFVGPNVRVGRLAVVGARAVVVKDVPEGVVVAGNPARIVKVRVIANP